MNYYVVPKIIESSSSIEYFKLVRQPDNSILVYSYDDGYPEDGYSLDSSIDKHLSDYDSALEYFKSESYYLILDNKLDLFKYKIKNSLLREVISFFCMNTKYNVGYFRGLRNYVKSWY